jgi:hypothetical protein
VAAGCVAGLALQTKYPALLPLVAGIAHAGWSGRPRVAIALGASAALPFVGFELWLLARQGVSHFAMAVLQVRAIEGLPAQHWIGALLGLLGSSSTGLALLSWLALGASRRVVVLASGAVAAGVLAIALLPGAPVGGEEALLAVWRPEMWIFLPQGLFALAGLLGLAWRTGRRIREAGDGGDARDPSGAACDRFALLWLGIELVGFFVLSPYPALRRLIGLQVAFGVLIARSLERRGRHGLLVPLAAFGAALGLLFAVSDATDARTREDVLERAIARLDAEPWLRADATRWYVGHWGFQVQAERHGLRPIVPGVSRLAPGDAVLVPSGVYRQAFRVPGERLVTIETLAGRNPWPWSTLPWAYAGYPPLRAQPDAQIRVRIGRVVAPARAR